MRRSIFISLAACITLCACAVVTAVELAIDWLLDVMPVEAPDFRLAGDLEPTPAFAIARDPRVVRHEAGSSRLAAARRI